MYSPTVPYRKTLKDGLVLKSIASEQDVERVAAFHDAIRDWEVTIVRELIMHHPNTRPEHWLFVEDEEREQVVSSLCLVPWTWCYQGAEIKAGEMAIVGTLEAYRRRGLVRALVGRFEELLCEGGYDLSHVQGIPYFYRQFGYEYALPLKGGWRVELHQVPDPPRDGAPPPYAWRLSTADDLPALVRLYDEASQELSIHTVRSEAEWRYLLGPSIRTEMGAETWLAVDESGKAAGYARIPAHDFGDGLIVNEVSRLDARMALAALRFFKALSVERRRPYILLSVPQESALIQTARYLGAHDEGRYAWQIRLVDVARLLRKLAPVFERRIAASPLAGVSKTVRLNLYREAFDLRFERGKLAAVEALGFQEEGDIWLPPPLLAPLLLGYKTRQELAQNYPDFSAWGESQLWVDVLFPKVESFIYTIY